MDYLDVFFVEDWIDSSSPTLDLFDSESIVPLTSCEEDLSSSLMSTSGAITVNSDLDAQSCLTEDPAPSRKRKRNTQSKPRKPTVDKNDPRRFLITEILEAYNSSDINTIWRFLQTRATEDVVLRMLADGDVSGLMPALQKTPVVCGREQVCEYWYAHTVAIPDDVMVAEETKLYVRSDGTGTLMSSVSVSGAPVLNNDVIDGMLENTLQNPSCAESKKSSEDVKPAATAASLEKEKAEDGEIDPTVMRVLSRVGNAMNGIFNHFSSHCKLNQQVEQQHPLNIRTNSNQWMVSPDDIRANERRIRVLMTVHLNADQKIEMIDYLFSLPQHRQCEDQTDQKKLTEGRELHDQDQVQKVKREQQ